MRRLELIAALMGLLLPGFLATAIATAQQPSGGIAGLSISALRIRRAPAIDGRLDENEWRTAPAVDRFVQQRPSPDAPASERTEVRILYTDEALFVGARLDDVRADSIIGRLGRRDTEVFGDWFFVFLDSDHDRRTAFVFGMNPAGVQRDYMRVNDSETRPDWDAIWEGVARATDHGWTVEMRIPLSQLRFSACGGCRWGVNFSREIARRGEVSYWAPEPPNASGFVSRFGVLDGLADLERGRRAEARPYVTGRATRAPGDRSNPFFRATDLVGGVGADLSLGVGRQLTLAATVNPDFAQVEADPAQVNLSAFELWLPEKRPFFLEGGDVFDSEWPQLFYSRRIGRPPHSAAPGDARFADVPDATSILAAAKLTGKTGGGWTVGILDAVTGRESARYVAADGETGQAPVEPLSNYLVARLKRDLAGGRSTVGTTLTATHRALGDVGPFRSLTSSAFAGGIDGRHRFGGGDYELSGSVRGSSVAGSEEAITRIQRSSVHFFQRPDARHLDLDSTRTSLGGANGRVRVAKIGGGRWTWAAGGEAHTPGFEVNDLGFNTTSDRAGGWLTTGYTQDRAGRHLRRWSLGGFVNSFWTFGGEPTSRTVSLEGSAQLANFWTVEGWTQRERSSLSTHTLRGGPALRVPGRWNIHGRVETDRRRSVVTSLSSFLSAADDGGGRELMLSPSLTVRPSTRFELSVKPTLSWNDDPTQYVGTPTVADSARYIVGRLDQRTVSVTTRLAYTFTPALSLQLYAQPFLSAGTYDSFSRVASPRAQRLRDRLRGVATHLHDGSVSIDENRDGRVDYSIDDPAFNTRELRSNLVLRWEYRPGSTLFVAWTQARGAFDQAGELALRRDIDRLFEARGTNVVMVKVSYWIGF